MKIENVAEKFAEVPSCHKYSFGHMHIFLQLVLSSSLCMRAASRALDLVFSFLELEIEAPSWQAGRMWILRVGLYKLERPKTIAGDWIWIVDHTVQLGNMKCMAILGIRRKDLPDGELHLKLEDLEPIALYPVEKSNGEIVYRQLEDASEKTGVPAQIVSDKGPDVNSGIGEFCRKHDVLQTYDIKHKGAAICKRELKDDENWLEFSARAAKTAKMVQQTELAAWCPPNQRSKARYMNLDRLVSWGADMISYWNSGEIDSERSGRFLEKFGWLFDFEIQLEDWKSLVEITGAANEYVNFVGLYKGVHSDLREVLDELSEKPRFASIKDELVSFAEQEQAKIKDDGRYIGSSEIIESTFGKFKALQNDQAKGGFTGMLLGLAASVSDLSMDTVKAAIRTVKTNEVGKWIKNKLGESVSSQRKKFRQIAKEQEQKQDELFLPI